MVETTEKELAMLERETLILYLYTPLCGTCQLAKKMLGIVEQTLSDLPIYQCNINFAPSLSKKWKIESVPCLVILKNREIKDKIYAFQSVSDLFEKLKPYAKSDAHFF